MMDDDWATSGVLEKDVFISSVHDEKDTLDVSINVFKNYFIFKFKFLI